MSHARILSLLLALFAASCGGSSGLDPATGSGSTSTQLSPQTAATTGTTGTTGATGATGTTGTTDPAAGSSGSGAITLLAGAPGTPAPATTSSPLPTGGSGSGRWQMGAAQGLYVVDPAAGGTTVEGLVVVTFGAIGTGNFIPPADAAVTLNGVPLLRDPNLNGAYWRVDPAGPQPQVGSGGQIVLVATATVNGTLLQRTLVLQCPSDIDVNVALGASDLQLSSASDIASFNVGVPLMASIFPSATLYGYDPATRALSGAGSPVYVARGPLSVNVPLAATAAPAYLLDLRWPGPFVLDGETGSFCGLAKRWAFAK